MKLHHLFASAAFALAAPLVLSAPALAQTGESELHAGTLEVPINKSQVVSADRPISKALVGNPEIADVLPISNRSIYVLGKKAGTTSLTLYDAGNRVIAIMDISVGPDVEGLRDQLNQTIPGNQIKVNLSNGSILLSGLVNDSGAAARAAQLAKAYAGENVVNLIAMGSSQQVMLEVKFAEINRQLGEKLGVSATGTSPNGFGGVVGGTAGFRPGSTTGTTTTTTTGTGTTISSTSTNTPGALLLGAITDTFGVLTKSFTLGNVDINATLDMLERRGLSKTLAEPTLIALSGEKASFLAGGEFPIPVSQSNSSSGGGGSAITIEFKPFGVSLAFTPTVLGDRVISMVVEPEVSSIDPTASITVNGLVIPGLQTRRASTTVELRDGESFAIAGLIRSDYQTTVRQLPILGSIPILGALFRSSSFQKGETELLIVVTPRLVAPIRPQQVRLPTDRIEDPRAIDVLIDGEGYRPKALAPIPGAAPVGAGATSEAVPAVPQASNGELPSLAAAMPASISKEPGYEY